MIRRRTNRKGDGTIYPRKDSPYLWVAYSPGPGLPQKCESSGTTDYSEAERFLRSRIREAIKQEGAAEVLGMSPGQGIRKMTVTALLNRYVLNYCVERNIPCEEDELPIPDEIPPSDKSRLRRLHSLIVDGRPFGTHDVKRADPTRYRAAFIKDFRNRRERDPKPATANRELEILEAAYALALAEPSLRFAVPYSPRFVYGDESGNVRRFFVDEGTFRAVISALLTAGEPEIADYAIFVRLSGWRPEEVQKLLWRDVRWSAENGSSDPSIVLSAEDAKSGESDSLPCVGELAEVIRRRYERRTIDDRICDRIFHRFGRVSSNGRRGGESIVTKDARRAWRVACVTAGCSNLTVKDLNRCAIKDMIDAGVPETDVMAVAHRKTRGILDRYKIVSPENKIEAQRKLAEHLAKKSGRKILPLGEKRSQSA